MHDAAFQVSLVAGCQALHLTSSILGIVNKKTIGVYPKFCFDFVATVDIRKH
jgi:hypothetical protein